MLYLPDYASDETQSAPGDSPSSLAKSEGTEKIKALQDEYEAKIGAVFRSGTPQEWYLADVLHEELMAKLLPLLEEQSREMRGR